MSRRLTVARVLAKLQQLEQQAASRGHDRDGWEFQHARLLLEYLKKIPSVRPGDAFIATFPLVYHRTWKEHQELERRFAAELQQCAQLAQDPALFISPVDGRTGDQWTASVLAYLAWRAGESWRYWRELHCSPNVYAQAAHLVRNAQHSIHPVNASPVSGLPPKKP